MTLKGLHINILEIDDLEGSSHQHPGVGNSIYRLDESEDRTLVARPSTFRQHDSSQLSELSGFSSFDPIERLGPHNPPPPSEEEALCNVGSHSGSRGHPGRRPVREQTPLRGMVSGRRFLPLVVQE